MVDDLRKTGSQDGARINVDQDHEVRYWAEKLDCGTGEIREAVRKVGPMVSDVRKHLSSLRGGRT